MTSLALWIMLVSGTHKTVRAVEYFYDFYCVGASPCVIASV